MTYPDDTFDEIDTDEAPQQTESHDIRQLRNKAKKADEYAKENAALKRQIAFTESGIDLNSPHGKLFAKAYDGAPTADAVRASAIEFGVLAPPPPVVDQTEEADLRVIAQVAQSNATTAGTPSNTINANDVAEWGMEKSMRFAQAHPTEWEALKRGEEVLRP